ncbi:MAG TPA: methyltransferase domain-containing protein [Dehalococcoidales bacterium]|nr:methyltransferase domain-containing protein [Dehalococcoidales bacterium]
MSILLSHISERRLKEFIESTYWYHTIEFPNGWTTEGTYDLRPYLSQYGFPESLHGKQVLDVGAADGFFSFELERRGAKKVLAIDTNMYDGSLPVDTSPIARNSYIEKYSTQATENEEYSDILEILHLSGVNKLLILKDIFNSSIEFKNYSIYDLASLGEKYDLVFCGALIEHLKNPLIALENLRAVTRELCIISLSSALPSARLGKLAKKAIRTITRILKFEGDFLEASGALRYKGLEGGGSFFHFTPSTFRDALLASGFKSIKIHSEFDLPNLRRNTLNHHVIFHCKV